jgi:hypothetical protein
MRKLQDGEETYSGGAPVICWKRTADVFPEALWSETDFVAIDCSRQGADEQDRCIGGLLQETHGPYSGTWVWTMTVRMPGSQRPFAAHGREESRENASHRLIESYLHMLRSFAAR